MGSFSTPLVEPKRTSDWLLYEEQGVGRYSREAVTFAANQNLKDGTPVGTDGSGNYIPYDDVATGGGDVCKGILVGDLKTGTNPGKGVIIARHARVVPEKLTWGSLAQPAKDAAIADLAALGVVRASSV